MAIIGYVRVSTEEQNTDRQLTIMESYKATKIFTEKISGKNTDRPQLKAMLDYIREVTHLLLNRIAGLQEAQPI